MTAARCCAPARCRRTPRIPEDHSVWSSWVSAGTGWNSVPPISPTRAGLRSPFCDRCKPAHRRTRRLRLIPLPPGSRTMTRRNSRSLANLAALAGVSWVRDRLRWREIQPQAGALKPPPTTYDSSADAQRAAGLQVLQVFHDTPPWAQTEAEAGGRFATDLRRVYELGRALAVRFKGRVAAWEPWNEANVATFGAHTVDQMCSWQKAAWLGFKAGDPEVIVGWNATAAVPTPAHTEGVLANETWPYFDTYNIHTYDWSHAYADLWKPAREAAAGRPLWITEADRGTPHLKNPPWYDQDAAAGTPESGMDGAGLRQQPLRGRAAPLPFHPRQLPGAERRPVRPAAPGPDPATGVRRARGRGPLSGRRAGAGPLAAGAGCQRVRIPRPARRQGARRAGGVGGEGSGLGRPRNDNRRLETARPTKRARGGGLPRPAARRRLPGAADLRARLCHSAGGPGRHSAARSTAQVRNAALRFRVAGGAAALASRAQRR